MSNQYQNQPAGNSPPVQSTQRPTVQSRESGSSLDFITTDNRDAEYREAVRHSRKVKFWKFAFPVIGVAVIMVIAGALVINSVETGGLTIGNVEVSDGNLVMEAPELNGFDKNNRPYSLNAETAVQDVTNPGKVELTAITAQLPMDDKITATIEAGNGIYDADAKTLVLRETINLVTSSGMRAQLQDADVDIENSTMFTNNPISATSPEADISSQTMRVEDGGNRMIFEGRVRMTIRPDVLKKTSDANGSD